MLLSEAIRLGAMLGPKLTSVMTGEGGASCALGSAALALGYVHSYGDVEAPYKFIQSLFPDIRKTRYASNYLDFEIWWKNDQCGWSREEIADWLVSSGYDCESVPQPDPVQTEVPQEVHVCV